MYGGIVGKWSRYMGGDFNEYWGYNILYDLGDEYCMIESDVKLYIVADPTDNVGISTTSISPDEVNSSSDDDSQPDSDDSSDNMTIEEVLSEHQSVAECAVLGIADKLKGQLPIGLIVLKTGVDKDNETISKECIKMVRDKIGPVAAFKVAIVIKRLPKTRSGKILRGTIRKIADSVEYKIPPTIDDPAILDEIKEDLINNNILKGG